MKKGMGLFIIAAVLFCDSVLAEDLNSVFKQNMSNSFLLNPRPFSGQPPTPMPLFNILMANLVIIVFDLIIFLSIYSFIERFDDKNTKVLALLGGYLLFVIPVFVFAPVSFIFMTFFYMLGILVPSLIKKKYIPMTQRIGFGGGYLNEDIKGFGESIGKKDNNYYD